MNKGVIKKISFIALATIMIFTGKTLATDTRDNIQNKLQESNINSMFFDKSLGYSAVYDLRSYNYLTIKSPGDTNAGWAIVAAKLFEYSNKNTSEVSAKHIDYATAYNSTTEGNSNSHNRNLGTAANMKVALGYFTSGRGPVSEGDFSWDGNLNQVSNSTLNSKNVLGMVQSYKIFPSIYKMTYDDGRGGKFTIAYNDPIIYNTSSNQVGSKFSASKDISSYNGGEVEQIREEIKEHIVKHGAVAAKIYRNDSYMSAMDSSESVTLEYDYSDNGGSGYYLSNKVTKNLVDTPSYYCNAKGKTPNHDVVIIGWNDTYQAEGAPDVGAYLVMDPTEYHAEIYTIMTGPYKSQSAAKNDGYPIKANRKWWSRPGYWWYGYFIPTTYVDGVYNAHRTKDYNYYYVSYYDYYIESEVYGIEDFSYSKYSNTYQHDVLGLSTSLTAENSSTIAYGANVFNRTTTTPETLNAVSIASEADMKYEIYVNPKDGTLSSDKLIKVAETDVLKPGYHTIELNNIVVLTGNKFAVAVKYIAQPKGQTVTFARIGVEAPKQKMYKMVSANQTEVTYDAIPFWSGKATSSAGQSFVGTTLDNWTDLYSKSETKDTNICIKAFTTTNAGYKIPAEKVEIKNNGAVVTEPIQVIKGDSLSLEAVISPSDVSSKAITWTSDDKSIATVDRTGLVTTNAAGKVKITAICTSYPTIRAECTIDVRVPVTSFMLNKSDVTILAGETNVLAAIIGPEDATTTKVQWSSNNKEVVKVTDDGLLIGLKQGNAIVTAVLRDENGLHTATCKVTVPISLVVGVTGVKLNKTTMNLAAGSRETLTATVTPADATNTSLVWTSSDKNVAIVNTNGRVTALAPGISTITVTTVSGGEQATCKVTVTEPQEIKVTGVSLNTTSASLQRDQTLKLTAYVTPSNSQNQNVTWSSSNYNIVDVNSNGTITAISPGTATITVKTEDGGYTASCNVTVVKPKINVTGITLNKTNITVNRGNTAQLLASIEPVDADNKNIRWTTSNSAVATVNSAGLVTAVGYGNAIITATTEEGSYYKKCVVTVPDTTEVAVTGISLSSTNITVQKGTTVRFTAEITPSNATNKNIIVEFSDQTVAVMSGNGIKGLKVGTTTVTFRTEDGNKTATCRVTVTENTANVPVTSNDYGVNPDKEIYNVPSNTTPEDFKENIDTEGTVTQIKDKDNNPLPDDSPVGTGSTVTVTKEEGGNTTTETYTVIVQGDINGDGKVTEDDINKVEQQLSGQTQLTGVGAEAADIDGDGQITIKDLELMKQESSQNTNKNLPPCFMMNLNPVHRSISPGGTLDIYVEMPDLEEYDISEVQFELNYDRNIFDTISVNDITGLNGWKVLYNNTTGKFLLTNNNEVATDINVLKITVKTKAGVLTGNGQISINNAITTDGTNEINGISEPLTIYVQELSSNVYNLTEDYRITNIAPDTTLAAFKQKLLGSSNTTIKDKNGNIISDSSLITTGSTITTSSGEVYTAIVKGDVDGDGTIGVTDVSKVKLHYIGLELLQEPYLSAGDVDLNGEIGLTDVSKVKMHYIGLETIE